MTAEHSELRRRVNDKEAKTFEAVSSAEQRRAKLIAKNGERDALAAKCEELTLEVECMPGLAERASGLPARVAELEGASMTKVLKVWANRRTPGRSVVINQLRTECAEHKAWIAQFGGSRHELKSKLDFLERCCNVSNLRYSMLGDGRDLLKRQIASSKVCIGELVQ